LKKKHFGSKGNIGHGPAEERIGFKPCNKVIKWVSWLPRNRGGGGVDKARRTLEQLE